MGVVLSRFVDRQGESYRVSLKVAQARTGAVISNVTAKASDKNDVPRQAMKLMAAYLAGDKSVVPESKKIIVPTLAIQQDSVDDFWAKLKILRGK